MLKMTITDVSVTALPDVIRTGRVTEVVADKSTGNQCTVTVEAATGEQLKHLLRALSVPHDPSKMLAVRDLP